MARDLYHYFRIEAQELLEGLGSGLAELEKAGTPETVRKVLRLAHTLKGAARVVKLVDVGEIAHRIEDLLSPLRESPGAVERKVIDEALAYVELMRTKISAISTAPKAAPTPEPPKGAAANVAPPAAGAEEGFQTLRLAIGDVDALIGDINESLAAAAALHHDGGALLETAREADALTERAALGGGLFQADTRDFAARLGKAARKAHGLAEQLTRGLANLRASAVTLRLMPAQVLVAELERAAREVGQSVGKTVQFTATGADTRIDAAVLNSLRGALRHVVQNAVVHGIEDERARLAAGKARAGSVQLVIERRGHRVAFLCRDDGRGLDLESVRKVAVERGVISRGDAGGMDARQLIELLMRGGVSTARSVSYVAGRGIGLDVVRQTVASLKGEVGIRTNAGRGTEVELEVPISLSSLPALELEYGGVSVFAPLDNVRQTLRPRRSDIARSAEGERVRIDDEFIPYASLGRALSFKAQPSNRTGAQTMVVLEAGGRRAAVGVDRLRGIKEIILHSIPAHARASMLVAGAALDDEGSPRLVLSPASVVQTILQSRDLREEPKPRTRPPILVVDDSLTTRMLEQSILESAGYECDLAVSAEEGLELAQKRRYGLCIVDVEMPGMNGFEFIAKTRQDAELRNVPCVLVTSRSDPEDKRRGKEVGARAYVVKSEFNQQEILKLIERLMG